VEEDGEIRALLQRSRSIAVVGIKDAATDDAFRVPRYLQAQGYRILPVNPKLDRVLGRRAFASLAELDEPVDLVNLFRAPVHLPAHVDEILALAEPPRCVWMQLGIRHPEAAQRLERAGIAVVQDRCLMVEHRRLLSKPAVPARSEAKPSEVPPGKPAVPARSEAKPSEVPPGKPAVPARSEAKPSEVPPGKPAVPR